MRNMKKRSDKTKIIFFSFTEGNKNIAPVPPAAEPGTFDLSSYIFKQQELQSQQNKKTEMKQKAKEEKEKKRTEEQVPAKVRLVNAFFEDPHSKLYCLFLSATLPLFDKGNLVLQQEEPAIYIVHTVLTEQLSDLLVRFIKPSIIAEADQIHNVDLSGDSQVADENLLIGNAARMYIDNKEKLVHLATFFEGVRQFYTTSCQYMMKKFPYGDDVLTKAKVLDVKQRLDAHFADVLFFITRFPCLLEMEKADELEGQFLNYTVDSTVVVHQRIDETWHAIS